MKSIKYNAYWMNCYDNLKLPTRLIGKLYNDTSYSLVFCKISIIIRRKTSYLSFVLHDIFYDRLHKYNKYLRM